MLQAEAARRRVYEMLVVQKALVQGFHCPFPALAYVEKTGTGYREFSVARNPTIQLFRPAVVWWCDLVATPNERLSLEPQTPGAVPFGFQLVIFGSRIWLP